MPTPTPTPHSPACILFPTFSNRATPTPPCHAVQVRYGGAIGRQHMGDADLGLEGVVQPPPVGAVVALGSRLLGGLGWFA